MSRKSDQVSSLQRQRELGRIRTRRCLDTHACGKLLETANQRRKRPRPRSVSNLALRPRDLGIGHLFERVWDAVIVADAHTGRIVLWNPAATELFGYSVSEALEMNVEELVPERLRERHRAGLARYRETGHGPYVDSRELLDLPALRKDGGETRIEMSLSTIEPVRNVGDEERRYALAVVRDITERKTTEVALRESEERFHALVQNSLDIVMVTDAQGTIRYVSPSVERVLGYRSEEMVGTGTAEYVHPQDLERALWELAEAASKPGVHPVAVETRVRHKDGSWRHLERHSQQPAGRSGRGGHGVQPPGRHRTQAGRGRDQAPKRGAGKPGQGTNG